MSDSPDTTVLKRGEGKQEQISLRTLKALRAKAYSSESSASVLTPTNLPTHPLKETFLNYKPVVSAMRSIESVWYSTKRHFRFKGHEIAGLFYTALTLGFVMTFTMWGTGETPNPMVGFPNLILYSLIILLILLYRESVRKFFAVNTGVRAEFRFWSYGAIGSIIVAILTNGIVTLYWAGNAFYELLEVHRLGRFRYGMTQLIQTNMALASIMSTMGLAIALKMIKVGFNITNPMLDQFIWFCILLSLLCLVPLPRLDGMDMLFRARIVWFSMVGLTVSLAAATYLFNNLFLILLTGFVGMLVFFVIWYLMSDRHYYDDLPV